jgi:hypothetical protein
MAQVFLNIVLDDAVEEKDGGEKVRLGMVVSSAPIYMHLRTHARHLLTLSSTGYSRKLGCDARGAGEDRRREGGPRMRGYQTQQRR